ncbi:hypothetical protein C8R44DRAFT_892479 [Mycena epipterygia]|nr:hypothetical protein C8R44DRAFT_892479 [Mycena epipterygia]
MTSVYTQTTLFFDNAHNAWPPHQYIGLKALCMLPTGRLGMLEDMLRAQGINTSVSGLEQRVDKQDGGEWGECDGDSYNCYKHQ